MAISSKVLISVKHLVKEYNHGTVHALDGCDLDIHKGEVVAIIGPSGSGKTTICSLLARFYDPQGGSIFVGGRDLREFTCDSLLSNISMVFQNVYLFNDTIRTNILFGKPDATEDEMIAAAKKARCHDFIMALPNGYDTVVGEGGGTLSGGEAQRLKLASEIGRIQTDSVFVFDEPSIGLHPLDVRVLLGVFQALLDRGATVVVIEHDLDVIRSADYVIDMGPGGGEAGGRIVAVGTPEEIRQDPGSITGRYL